MFFKHLSLLVCFLVLSSDIAKAQFINNPGIDIPPNDGSLYYDIPPDTDEIRLSNGDNFETPSIRSDIKIPNLMLNSLLNLCLLSEKEENERKTLHDLIMEKLPLTQQLEFLIEKPANCPKKELIYLRKTIKVIS